MFKGIKFVAGAAFALIAAVQTPAFAFGPGALARNFGAPGHLEFVSAAQRAPATYAHVEFCKSNPDECAVRRSRWPHAQIALSEQRFAMLHTVNRQMNRQGQTGASFQTIANERDDLAVTKRHALIAQGFPARALRLAITYTAEGTGHMVLIAKTDGGDLVLDNRTDAIRRWNANGQRSVMIEATGFQTAQASL